ncbi:hypothetical protein [Pseudofrankia asymbiotica]|uniref:Uncharacterized protein n=1 Tax=Pseudofrankia asymbiotica TaxID=1834516 RepID=A0A1V2IGY5_9ACTN|nr:hypothetical protein [Pseudofrankia asymbiotica]ONH32458.1 hypothetical protein BL253_05375 [Pseudofrankia asymbiotica]
MTKDSDDLVVKAADEDQTAATLHRIEQMLERLLNPHGLNSGGGTGTNGGTSAAAIPDGTPVVIVDSSGMPIGTGTYDASTGTIRQNGSETTVIVRTSAGSRATIGGPGGAPVDIGSTSPDREPIPTSGTVYQPVDPSLFEFRSTGPNWQESKCVRFGLAFRVSGYVLQTVDLFVRVGAPKRLNSGVAISPARAAELAALAVAEAAPPLVESLELAVLDPSGAQPRFLALMSDMLRLAGFGFRANQCFTQ